MSTESDRLIRYGCSLADPQGLERWREDNERREREFEQERRGEQREQQELNSVRRIALLRAEVESLRNELTQVYSKIDQRHDVAIEACGEALGEIRKCRQLDDVPWYIARLAAALAAAGNQGEARSLLEELQELSKRRYITPECYFVVYTALGERDSAFTWLQKMYDVRSQYPLRLKVQPDFDGLRTDPRFSEWLRRLKLAP